MSRMSLAVLRGKALADATAATTPIERRALNHQRSQSINLCALRRAPQLWEWEQPYIDDLVLNARTFNRRVVGWWFKDWDALDQENTRIWQTYYEPKPLSELYAGWQEMLAEYRQLVVQVQEIAEETEWRGAGCTNPAIDYG